MHITVEGIILSKLEFEIFAENREKLAYELHVECKSHISDENILVQNIEFDVTHDIEDPPFRLEFTLTAFYKADGEGSPTLEEFSMANGPAYVIPYARELIANITSRAGIPTLIIPPVNVFALIEKGLHVDEEKNTEEE